MALAAVCKTLRASCADAVPTIRDRNAIRTQSLRTVHSSSIPPHAVMPVSTTGADARTARMRCQGRICSWTDRPLSESANDDIWFDVPRERIYIAGIGNKTHPPDFSDRVCVYFTAACKTLAHALAFRATCPACGRAENS